MYLKGLQENLFINKLIPIYMLANMENHLWTKVIIRKSANYAMPMNNEEARRCLKLKALKLWYKKREKFLKETSIKLASC